jgi:hypothetical protein
LGSDQSGRPLSTIGLSGLQAASRAIARDLDDRNRNGNGTTISHTKSAIPIRAKSSERVNAEFQVKLSNLSTREIRLLEK